MVRSVRLLVILPLLAVAVVGLGRSAEASGAPAVRVSGNQLVDGSGAALHLSGVDRSGAEYACIQGWGIFDGPVDAASVAAIAAWNANAVRVPLNEDCWLGINGVKAAYGGASYRSAIQRYVSVLHAYGLAAVLDLHWSAPGRTRATGQLPMPDADHSPAFWTSLARTFANDPSTVFDLFNEPFVGRGNDTAASWACWRDGGQCGGLGYKAAGMQKLVSTVRAAGASNVVMVGGLSWSNDLSQWAQYRPSDPLNQLAASFHMYGGTTCATTQCWDSQVAPVAAAVPVVTGEFGVDVTGTSCSTSLVVSYMQWADRHAVAYLAWTWDAWGGCGVLITDYNGTPSAFGLAVRNHFLGTGP